METLEKIKKMKEERSQLLNEVDEADESRFDEIRSRVEKLNYLISSLEKESEERSNTEVDNERERGGTTPAAAELRGNGGEKAPSEIRMNAAEMKIAGYSALGKMLRSKISGTTVNFSQAEARALGEVYYTTSNAATVATASGDGVNNGGVFIPQMILYDLLKIDEVDNPFLKDCTPTFEKGVLVYPYVKTETYTKDKAVKEREKAGAKSVEFDTLKLKDGDYAIKAGITLELLAKADSELGEYILSQLAQEADLILSEDVFYGTGDTDSSKNTRILGVSSSTDTTKVTYDEGKEIETIADAYLSLSRRARKGAKLYISRKLSMKLTLKKDDSGRYLLPIYNGVGIKTIVEIPVETVEDLKDYDFILGNAKNYKLNFYGKNYSIYQLALTDSDSRVQKWLLHMMVGGAPAPKYFIYGKLKAGAAA